MGVEQSSSFAIKGTSKTRKPMPLILQVNDALVSPGYTPLLSSAPQRLSVLRAVPFHMHRCHHTQKNPPGWFQQTTVNWASSPASGSGVHSLRVSFLPHKLESPQGDPDKDRETQAKGGGATRRGNPVALSRVWGGVRTYIRVIF